MMTAELTVAIVALVVSMVSFAINYKASSDAERHGRMPVLVPRNDLDRAGVVIVRNVGRGPAINVVIAKGPEALREQDAVRVDLARHRDRWKDFLHLDPIESNTEITIELGPRHVTGLHYTDALGHPYTVLAGRNGTKMVDGSHMEVPPLNELDYATLVPEQVPDPGGHEPTPPSP
jgi:hypothetical protein